jgi:UDP-N-acetylmuramoyl-L-alanyl-D-glutamate--2,6-diaminopimelate ligase
MTTTNTTTALFDVLQGAEVTGALPKVVTGVVCDSRQVRAGNVFVAISGTHKQGSEFVDDAVQRGAVAVVSEGSPRGGHACWVKVADARLALAQLAAEHNGNPSTKMFVAGITGTNGKTTTAYILRELFCMAGREPGLIGTVEYCIGGRVIPAARTTPEAPVLQQFMAQMLGAGCDAAVMEVSSHALVQKRVAAIDFDVAVLTNLSRDHLDYHKTREGYAEAKKLLFTGLRSGAAAVINTDDELGARIASEKELAADIITYGTGDDADLKISEIQPGYERTSFTLSIRGELHSLQTNMMGRFNVFNIVAALAVAERAGLDMVAAMKTIAQLPIVPGRLEEVPNSKGIKVLVDYAHTDDALEQILTALRETTEGRLLLVFGCGGDRDKSKRPAMGEVAAKMADHTVITSDNPRKEKAEDIISDIEAGFSSGSSYEVEVDRESAIRRAVEMAKNGDVLVIAGKGHENFQEFENTTVSFDDRNIVRKILEEGR